MLLRGYFLKVAYFSSELIKLAQLTFQKLFNRFFFFSYLVLTEILQSGAFWTHENSAWMSFNFPILMR